MDEYSIKHVKTGTFHVISGLYRDFLNFVLTDFDASKSVLGSFFAFFAKIWPKNMYRSSKSRKFFCLTFFTLVTWDDLDLYYGHKAQEMISYRCQWHYLCRFMALFALNIEILLADVTKSEKSKILTLTWPVTSSVTSRSNFWPCTVVHVQGYRMAFEIWKSVQYLGDLRGGPLGPPPAGTCYYPDPSGARVNDRPPSFKSACLNWSCPRRRLHCSAQNVQFAQNSTVQCSSFLLVVLSDGYRGQHGSLSAPVTRSSVNAESHYANANYLLNVAFI